mmetsp:Transcript_142272/g.454817  ORF Transcript_142272/g.454817 Transcript_142272/m.454817 type:complete len:210 (+) Transcript_142272:353-982(+)
MQMIAAPPPGQVVGPPRLAELPLDLSTQALLHGVQQQSQLFTMLPSFCQSLGRKCAHALKHCASGKHFAKQILHPLLIRGLHMPQELVLDVLEDRGESSPFGGNWRLAESLDELELVARRSPQPPPRSIVATRGDVEVQLAKDRAQHAEHKAPKIHLGSRLEPAVHCGEALKNSSAVAVGDFATRSAQGAEDCRCDVIGVPNIPILIPF